MTSELTVRPTGQSIMLSPQDVVANATTQAKLLMDIVTKTKCFQVISGKRYLQVEAWETIGAFNRVHAATESIAPIVTDGVVVGYDAKVNLVNHEGILVGSAIMPCYFTENACKGKEGDAKDKACKSAAQTFATSKAYRMNYSYVAILAGYEPVPAEEMTGEAPDERPANLEHWCEKHQTKFFKRGKMKGYAHPIGDSGEWCNEGEETAEAPPDAAQSVSAPVKAEVSDNVSTEQSSPIELVWLREQLEALQAKRLTAWTNANVLGYLNTLTGKQAKSIREAVSHLDKKGAAEFTKKISTALEIS